MAVYCGHVYHLYLSIAAKDKLLVPAYIQADGKVRFFVINTNLNNFIATRPALASHAVELPMAGNKHFLTHDSWLICHEVIGGWTVHDIDSNHGCYRGPLDGGTTASVRQIIQGSRLYSDIVRNQILAHWP